MSAPTSARTRRSARRPTSDRGSFDGEMVLAYNPTRVRVTPREAPQFGRLVIETNMDGVEVLVDGKSAGVVAKDKPLLLPGIAPGQHTDSRRACRLRAGRATGRDGVSRPGYDGHIAAS